MPHKCSLIFFFHFGCNPNGKFCRWRLFFSHSIHRTTDSDVILNSSVETIIIFLSHILNTKPTSREQSSTEQKKAKNHHHRTRQANSCGNCRQLNVCAIELNRIVKWTTIEKNKKKAYIKWISNDRDNYFWWFNILCVVKLCVSTLCVSLLSKKLEHFGSTYKQYICDGGSKCHTIIKHCAILTIIFVLIWFKCLYYFNWSCCCVSLAFSAAEQ